jgi:pimeloyl-ACP methyl ester carboxylesterase
VNINGTEQWITIRGQDASKPILLNLGMGGPGGGGFATRSLFEPLEKDFVVVAWDEPGTGKSYHAVPISTLTVDQFVDDAYALTMYLRDRFHQDKIYVYGVSWSSIIGVKLVQQHPELFHAFIGNGQMVNTTENDILGYELALDYLSKNGDTKRLETLRRNGPPPYTGKNVTGRYVAYLDVLQEYMNTPRLSVIVPIVPFMASEYGYIDKINHTRGLIESFQVVYPQLKDLDFITQAPKLEVPVYLFAGRNDVNAMYTIVEEYYNTLEAPRKELTWLEGGHGLDGSNLGQFVDVMVNKVKAETYPNK